jgi:hypothetical protein
VSQGKHNGVVVRNEAGEVVGFVDEPHAAEDCEAACEDALHKVLGHETAYEAPDAKTTRRTSAGWNRKFAAGYDGVDWSNW